MNTNFTYITCKTLITKGSYISKEDMMMKLDIFLLNERISEDHYNELNKLLNS